MARRMIAAFLLTAVVLCGCADGSGPSSGVYGGVDGGGEIRR
jgi:hypothetical protein